ncbi:chitinase [Streptomyces sulfonofaciens]|uniref:Chitinase n=1 Tax=Streptomyces sulfonofaciens TaxID=68272 RepID=A0A919G478_9ACTN|nr:carbohydrate-binding protein [Streptomyces sulfonofaciens]GHH76860.1 chitinase [Streptomyces sulfonofaciens]
MRRLRALLCGTATAALAAAGLSGLAVTQAAGADAAADQLSNRWYAAAPYLMPLDNDPPDATAIMDATGLKAFQLAFVLAPNGGGCSPTWDGTAPVAGDTAVAGVIDAIRAKGGDVSVSIGGYNGTKLGQACGTPEATAAAYQQVVTKYGLHAIDFDLEEPEYENTAAIHNEIGAARILQKDNPGLYVSVTTAGTAAGTGWFGQQMLNEAKAQGFTPNNFSIMPFDGGFQGASAQTAALTAFNGLLRSTFGWDEATAYAHEGFSGMNGRSDSGEMFPQDAFRTVLDFATSHGMDRFTFWSLNRDRQCTPPDNGGRTSGTCSSVPQSAWDFAKFSVEFAGATPPDNPPPTDPPGSGTCTLAAWDASAVYTGGQEVSYEGHTWKAKWWTQGEEPGSTGEWGAWQDEGPC